MCFKPSSWNGKRGKLSLMLILLLIFNLLLLTGQIYAGGDGKLPEDLDASNSSSGNMVTSAYHLLVDNVSDFFLYLTMELL